MKPIIYLIAGLTLSSCQKDIESSTEPQDQIIEVVDCLATLQDPTGWWTGVKVRYHQQKWLSGDMLAQASITHTGGYNASASGAWASWQITAERPVLLVFVGDYTEFVLSTDGNQTLIIDVQSSLGHSALFNNPDACIITHP